MTHGEYARLCRLRAGLTTKRLSEISGLCEGTIRSFENGTRETSIVKVVKLADVLKVSLDELIGREVKGEKRD